MKILVDLRKMGKVPTGIGVYIANSVNAILDNNTKNLEIIGFTDVLESELIKELSSRIKIVIFKKNVGKSIIKLKRYYRAIEKEIEDESYDLFWQPNNLTPYKFNKDIKIMTTVHDLFPITDKEHIPFLYRVHFKYFLKKSLLQTDKIICVSKKTEQDLLKNLKKETADKNLKVIPNIVEVNKKDIKNQEGDYFLYLGSLEERKGFDILIKAYESYVLEQKSPLKIIVAGLSKEKKMKSLIEKAIKKNPELVEYRGYIQENEKKSLLQNCNTFIFPSRAEGFGIPPVEALFYNKPLILSNLKIFHEVIGEDCNYFNLTDDEKEVENLKKALIKKSFKYNNIEELKRKYSSKNVGEKLINFLNE